MNNSTPPIQTVQNPYTGKLHAVNGFFEWLKEDYGNNMDLLEKAIEKSADALPSSLKEEDYVFNIRTHDLLVQFKEVIRKMKPLNV